MGSLVYQEWMDVMGQEVDRGQMAYLVLMVSTGLRDSLDLKESKGNLRMMVPFQDSLGIVVQMDSLVFLAEKEMEGPKASPALLGLLGLRAWVDREVQEDHLVTVEHHWQAIREKMVNKAFLAHRDLKKS